MNRPDEFKRDDQDQNSAIGWGGSGSNPNYKKPMSPDQIAWRVGLFVLGAIVGAILSNL